MSHYYQPAVSEDALDNASDTWAIAMRGFTQEVIEIAMVHWEVSEPKRRPTPADIRILCRDVKVALENQNAPRLPPPTQEPRDPVATPEQRLEIIRQVYGPEADASEVARTLAARAALTDGDPR